MDRAIHDSHRLWEPEQPIPLEPFAGGGDRPTQFVADFIHEDIRHQYGFAMNSAAVLKEWLYVYPKGKKQTWFNRTAGDSISFGEKLAGENRMIEQLTRSNSLFLSAAAQNNHEMLLPVSTGSGTASRSWSGLVPTRVGSPSQCVTTVRLGRS